jgi:hypothetical protein
MAKFADRIAELMERVGDGMLTGNVEVDQVYAQNQHESLDFKHPRGGQAKYLEQPLMNNYERYLQSIADAVTSDPGEPTVQDKMVEAVEDLAGVGGVATFAPVEHGYLRGSGHPSVTSEGETVYDRAPVVGRLTEEQLKVQGS